jgi:F0F1-type ATP synthase gamma subunit
MARPIEYNKSILKKVKNYINSCEDTDKQIVKQENAEKGYQMYENKLVVKIPTIEGLALYLHISRDTIYDWETKYKEFSDIIGELRAKQADRLMNNGLSGDYNSTIAKVLLTKHGYRDSQELTGKDGKDLLPQPILGGITNNEVHNNDNIKQDSEPKKEG